LLPLYEKQKGVKEVLKTRQKDYELSVSSTKVTIRNWKKAKIFVINKKKISGVLTKLLRFWKVHKMFAAAEKAYSERWLSHPLVLNMTTGKIDRASCFLTNMYCIMVTKKLTSLDNNIRKLINSITITDVKNFYNQHTDDFDMRLAYNTILDVKSNDEIVQKIEHFFHLNPHGVEMKPFSTKPPAFQRELHAALDEFTLDDSPAIRQLKHWMPSSWSYKLHHKCKLFFRNAGLGFLICTGKMNTLHQRYNLQLPYPTLHLCTPSNKKAHWQGLNVSIYVLGGDLCWIEIFYDSNLLCRSSGFPASILLQATLDFVHSENGPARHLPPLQLHKRIGLEDFCVRKLKSMIFSSATFLSKEKNLTEILHSLQIPAPITSNKFIECLFEKRLSYI